MSASQIIAVILVIAPIAAIAWYAHRCGNLKTMAFGAMCAVGCLGYGALIGWLAS